MLDANEHIPSVSVVIPTRNRCRLLQEAIESLWNQSLNPAQFEIIVVDNCSEDDTFKMITSLQATSPCRLLYHRMPENRGPARSRNTGVGLARAEIIAFTDSDCRVTPQWLQIGIETFRAFPDSAFVAGTVMNKPEQPVSFFSIGSPLSGENPTYPTANIFYRKSVLLELGGFDESVWFGNVGGRPCECSDTDFAWRVKDKGLSCRYVEDLIVYHEIMQVTPYRWLMVNAPLMFIPELIRRHPGFREKILWWGPFCLRDNLLFYLLLLGILLSLLTTPWAVVMAGPYLYRALTLPGKAITVARLPIITVRTFFLGLRQAAICWFLLVGSIRSRTLVL